MAPTLKQGTTASTTGSPDELDHSSKEILIEENRKLKEQLELLKKLYKDVITSLKLAKIAINTKTVAKVNSENSQNSMDTDSEANQLMDNGFTIVQSIKKKNLEQKEALKKINRSKDKEKRKPRPGQP